MTKEFIPYEQALALNELGFNEPCMATYYSKDKSFSWHHHIYHTNDEPILESGEFNISAPLYQQAMRWFREKKLHYIINPYFSNTTDVVKYEVMVYHSGGSSPMNKPIICKTYEEAEVACLVKLIEIVKNGKK